MSWINILNRLANIAHSFVNIAAITYDMIVTNPLLLSFILMCAIFVGVGLLKRLLDI